MEVLRRSVNTAVGLLETEGQQKVHHFYVPLMPYEASNIYSLTFFFNINNDLIRVMYNCFEIVNGPMWISSVNSLYTVNL